MMYHHHYSPSILLGTTTTSSAPAPPAAVAMVAPSQAFASRSASLSSSPSASSSSSSPKHPHLPPTTPITTRENPALAVPSPPITTTTTIATTTTHTNPSPSTNYPSPSSSPVHTTSEPPRSIAPADGDPAQHTIIATTEELKKNGYVLTNAGVWRKNERAKKAFTRRVRTGCHTCRRRKKKCDEARPVCGNCVRNQLPCDWPVTTEHWQTTRSKKRRRAEAAALNGVLNDAEEEGENGVYPGVMRVRRLAAKVSAEAATNTATTMPPQGEWTQEMVDESAVRGLLEMRAWRKQQEEERRRREEEREVRRRWEQYDWDADPPSCGEPPAKCARVGGAGAWDVKAQKRKTVAAATTAVTTTTTTTNAATAAMTAATTPATPNMIIDYRSTGWKPLPSPMTTPGTSSDHHLSTAARWKPATMTATASISKMTAEAATNKTTAAAMPTIMLRTEQEIARAGVALDEYRWPPQPKSTSAGNRDWLSILVHPVNQA